jgi:hypothetical protein
VNGDTISDEMLVLRAYYSWVSWRVGQVRVDRDNQVIGGFSVIKDTCVVLRGSSNRLCGELRIPGEQVVCVLS